MGTPFGPSPRAPLPARMEFSVDGVTMPPALGQGLSGGCPSHEVTEAQHQPHRAGDKAGVDMHDIMLRECSRTMPFLPVSLSAKCPP